MSRFFRNNWVGLFQKLESRQIVLLLLVLSAIFVICPVAWTGPFEKFFQAWLAPSARLSILAGQQIAGDTNKNESEKLNDEHLRRLFTSISFRIQELEEQNRQLMGIRHQIGNKSVLVPARLIGFDSLGLASIEVNRGSSAKIQADMPVLASIPRELLNTINLSPEVALSGGVVIGKIAYSPGPYTARVKLISSPDAKFTGLVLRYENGKTKTIARVRIEGTRKQSRMIAKMVPIKHGVKPGDIIVPENPKSLRLPCPMVIGIVDSVKIRTDNRLLANLNIKPAFDTTHLNRIYILRSR